MSKRGCKAFWRNENGATAALYALALPALVAVGGVGFDYARLAGMDSELQNAADQAALAGATQLDGKTDATSPSGIGACQRAINAARGDLVTNNTLLANDANQTRAVDIAPASDDEDAAEIAFFAERSHAEAYTGDPADANRLDLADADCDEAARFIIVETETRAANYALTPVVGAFAGRLKAAAIAGLGSSVCKVPPIMICNPNDTPGDGVPPLPFNAASNRGIGVVATGHSVGKSNNGGEPGSDTRTTWAPGDFGFLEVGESSEPGPKNAALLRALAYSNPPTNCVPIGENRVSTGTPQSLYNAINTRFDIYDFNDNGSNVLASCQGSTCPPSSNVVKDFINSKPGSSCKLKTGQGNNGGWELPAAGSEFKPLGPTAQSDGTYDDNGVVAAMGLPRDLCHYTSFNNSGFCAGGGGRFGDGIWAKADYFRYNHPGVTPPSGLNTRYDVYRWELGLLGSGGVIPSLAPQRGAPVCFTGSATPHHNRRVLTVAIVANCGDDVGAYRRLSGQSSDALIEEWVDVFLVEPSTDHARRYNAFKDAIYVEIIGRSQMAGDGSYASQQVRRDMPYLVR
ncbi:hypothetical protein GRI75_08180 [Altererythrobacter soli]|uniref:Putative Flp pilus-assembly TadG-like N-terminal domain-containing protein n=1 Tax=Croceibacterium soli TaxID=1739690 RepID=A0A6I4UV29_9SPHN|nr:pilus assembly protein TadG-related protein [Croceibacterium soli]MXP41619.1 hypothetical protein [Croceibacterium soli]